MAGLVRVVFIFINFFFWAIGVSIVGFVSWLLATNPSVSNFLSGTFIFTYTLVALGILIFIIGLFGCIGGCIENHCLLKTYIGFITTLFFLEVCAVLAAYVQKDQIPKYTATGWKEFNMDTKALIQKELGCCGYFNSSEYSVNLEKLPDSCFNFAKLGPGTITTKSEAILYKEGCWSKIEEWINGNTPIWASTIAVVALIQIASMVTSCLVLERVQRSVNRVSGGTTISAPMGMKRRPKPHGPMGNASRF